MTEETRRELQDIADDYGFIEKAGWPGVVITMKQYLMPCLEAAYELGEKAGRSAQKDEEAKKLCDAKSGGDFSVSEILGTVCVKCGEPANFFGNGICLRCDPTGGGCLGMKS